MDENVTESVEELEPPGGTDIGMWPPVITHEMQDVWAKLGPTLVQNCKEWLFEQYSDKQSRGDSLKPRICTTSIFARQHYCEWRSDT